VGIWHLLAAANVLRCTITPSTLTLQREWSTNRWTGPFILRGKFTIQSSSCGLQRGMTWPKHVTGWAHTLCLLSRHPRWILSL
jgi:hypothetical protein